ncbi:Aldo/keto reductase [Peniophora sp. CONT]|nr:Aldo/keto reductase [Peniophora sp. CONT]
MSSSAPREFDHTPRLETFQLGSSTVPRLWVGLWQLSSTAWGSASASKVRNAMIHHIEQGYNAFADHYGPAEILFGQVRESLPVDRPVLGATKWCIFKEIDPTREVVEAAVRERMARMRSIKSVDLLQFHWHDYSDKGYLTALRHLLELKQEGLISNIGLVNFDSIRVDEICVQLGPNAIATHQVQFSLIDTRPLHGMNDVCCRHGLKLLTYGTLCGGFLSDQWLGQVEPDPYSGVLTPSQRKYLDVITKAWGNWTLFQDLLSTLREIGDLRGGASIANVATRWVLDHSFVGAVLVGVRLGVSEHSEDNLRVAALRLEDEDRAKIEVVLDRSNGRKMVTLIGDCGAEYR